MTRINTNVSSLNAQKTLARSNSALQQALTRLSTGLRINVGKDDPAGLIASEALRSDITAVGRAISNSQRANQMIATADSALGQAASLLNDIRGLVTEAANTGAMSDEQIAANQLQVDSSLEALNRIAQTTTFQGKRLLDGSLDFLTTAGTGFSTLTNLQIDQANLGATGSIDVDIEISAAATKAQLTTDIDATTTAVKATATVDLAAAAFSVTAATEGATYNDVTIQFVEDSTPAASPFVSFNGTDTITIYVNDTADTDVADIVSAFAAYVPEFDAAVTAAGNYQAGVDDTETAVTAGGLDGGAGLLDDLVFELRGALGSEVFSFEAGASLDQVVAAVNLVSDATGVEATANGDTLELDSTTYGSSAFVEVSVISEGGAGVFESGLTVTSTALAGNRSEGTDVQASVNGITANGDGNTLSINTSTLDLTATVSDGSSTDVSFSITGGGALFQMGPDVVSNQQARLGISSVNASRLGGISGRLFELASGGTAALKTDPTTAAEIVEEAITQVSSLRGRLGAFQRTTLDTNVASLSDTLENLSEAESSIRDADFAAETAALTRAQILSQSGLSVLAIANSNPQNVLALLQ